MSVTYSEGLQTVSTLSLKVEAIRKIGSKMNQARILQAQGASNVGASPQLGAQGYAMWT